MTPTSPRAFLDALGILLGSPSFQARRAASCLVCAQVVRSNPIPLPAVFDAETQEIEELF